MSEGNTQQVAEIESKIKVVGDSIRDKKSQNAEANELEPLISELKNLKLELTKLTGKPASTSNNKKKKKGGASSADPEEAARSKAIQEQRNKEKKERQEQIKLANAKNAEKNKKKAAKPTIEYTNNTPKGEKKDLEKEKLLDAYHPPAVESAWYDWWEKKGFFKPEDKDGKLVDNPKGQFVMVIPPPNVTGSLHLGHALTNAIEDTLARWHRMLGKTVLWNPGCDHAGIATQVVVEKQLWKESKITRHDIGREKFVEKVWEWKEEYGSTIYNQLRELGASLDWDRACFTMDPKMVVAVKAAFLRLHKKGLIKRSNRMVNWSPTLKSAISDLEVDHKELEGRTMLPIASHDGKSYEFGVMTEMAYKVENSDEEIVIATTRPETMLGDVCIGVHPNDDRWKHLHGKFVVHPFTDRRMPILTDECVEIDKGTGALKITPGHDPKDFEFGRRHNQPVINILNDDGTINGICARFEGMRRYDARNAVVEALKELGLYRGAKSHAMSIPICSRTKDVVEDMVRPQWFLDCTDMAKRALDAVENNDLEIHPASHKLTWKRWLENENSADWCISRQLWWGHRIPAYQINIDGKAPQVDDSDCWIVADNEEEAYKMAMEKTNLPRERITLEQDPDVLDTWFSSGLFPFSIFGWPEQTEDFQKFFPGNFLETGHDILFFWVARMVMMSLALCDKLPFDTVYLHALVRDSHGRKMSKSLGNVIDPLDVIHGVTLQTLMEKLTKGNLDVAEIKKAQAGQKQDFPDGIPECGVDALRFTLVAYTMGGKDVNLDVNRIVANRHFCNKIWNAYKMFNMYAGDFTPAKEVVKPNDDYSNMDRWILSRLNNAVKNVNEYFKTFAFTRVTEVVHGFWKDDLCDVYIESCKPVFRNGSDKSKQIAFEVFYTCLETGLRLLHPIMPFVTEELWQRLAKRSADEAESLCIAAYPEEDFYSDNNLEELQALAFEATRNIRRLRTAYLEPKARPITTIVTKTSQMQEACVKFHSMIESLAELGELIVVEASSTSGNVDKSGCASAVVGDKAEVLVSVKGLVDSQKEIAKLEKKRKTVVQGIERLEKRFASPATAKIPAHIMEKEKERLVAYQNELSGIDESLQFYSQM